MKTTLLPLCVAVLALSPAFSATATSSDDADPRDAADADGASVEDDRNADGKPELPPILLEAELPEGFPEPGPAYEVLLKQYPVYRAARAEGSDAFGKLFDHINDHGIAMTAPVEMTLDHPSEKDDRVARMDMAFMYANPDMGELGPAPTPGKNAADREVEVVDLPAIQVLSLGFFGRADRQQVNDALAMVERYLTSHPDLEAAGPPRLLGYNSPFVPARRRYHEVQIPVAPVATEAAENRPAPAEATPQP